MASIDCAYQIEGGYYADGKGQSIWDVLSDTKGKTYLGQNGKIARDFYHRYAQDIAIMSQLKIPNFRFSLSWSRLVPAGIGAVNPTGRKGLNNFLAAAHHAALCQAEGGRIIRSVQTNAKVGATLFCSLIEPATRLQKDQQPAVRV